MATLLDALAQENLDNQREVVKNEKRQSYDNRPYGSFYEKLMAAVFPSSHPYHHTPIGSMEDLDAASLEDVIAFFRAWYAPNNAVLTIAGDVDEEAAHRGRGALVRAHPGEPGHRPAAGRRRSPPIIGREVARDRCPTTCRWCASISAIACPPFGTHEFDALEVGYPDPGRRPRLAPLPARSCASSKIAQDVAAFALPLVDGAAILRRLGHGPSGERCRDVRARSSRRLQRLVDEPVTDDELARARALIEAGELGALGRVEEVADRLSMYAACSTGRSWSTSSWRATSR